MRMAGAAATHSGNGWAVPGYPRFILSALEITSVCATFSLTSSQPRSMSDALINGVAISVNKIPWTDKVLVHVDEEKDDEAIMVLYGLFPGQKYDIELGILGIGAKAKFVTTTKEELVDDTDDASSTDTAVGEEIDPATSLSISRPASPRHRRTHSQSHSPTRPPSPALTLADHLSALHGKLASLQAAHVEVTTQLKNSRRESQRAQAMLRSELDGIKRASEKNQVGDQRARQKVLALQEAVKRAERSTREHEEEAEECEKELHAFEEECEELEERLREGREEEKEMREDVERCEKEAMRKAEEAEAELAGVRRVWEKWDARRDRMEREVVGALELRLAELEKELERVEAGLWDADEETEEAHFRSSGGRIWDSHSHSQDVSPPPGLTRTSTGESMAIARGAEKPGFLDGLGRRFSHS